MKAFLYRFWRSMPAWVHFIGAKIVRSKFRVAVAAMIFDEQGRILLFEHTYRKFQWGIPAGSLEYHEQPVQAVAREILEETGLEIEVQRMLTAISAPEDHHISLIYLCRILDGEFKPSHEISAIRYFDPGNLPQMLLAEKELIRQVAFGLHQGQ